MCISLASLPEHKRKNSTKPNGRARGPVTMLPRGDPFPMRANHNLRYGQALTLTAGSTGTYGTEQVMRLNSVFDPDLTGTGHQPYGFDTLASIYTKYKVFAITAEISFSDPSADGLIVSVAFQSPGNPITITGASPDTVMERPGTWSQRLNNTGSQTAVLKQHFPLWQLAGCTKMQFEADIDVYSSATSNNPNRTPYIRIAVAALDQASTPTVRCQVIILYHTEFYDRTTLAQS